MKTRIAVAADIFTRGLAAERMATFLVDRPTLDRIARHAFAAADAFVAAEGQSLRPIPGSVRAALDDYRDAVRASAFAEIGANTQERVDDCQLKEYACRLVVLGRAGLE